MILTMKTKFIKIYSFSNSTCVLLKAKPKVKNVGIGLAENIIQVKIQKLWVGKVPNFSDL